MRGKRVHACCTGAEAEEQTRGQSKKICNRTGENRKQAYCIKTRPKNQNKNGRILHTMHFSQAQSNPIDAISQMESITPCQGITYLALRCAPLRSA